MSNSIRIKRRASDQDAGISGVTLKNGELAYNEADDILYYGYGVSGANAAQIKGIAGVGRYVNKTSAQDVGGVKTFTELVNANGGIKVDTDKFVVADTTGNTTIDGTLTVGGVTDLQAISATSIVLSIDLSIADGGTGASTATDAATNLGLGTGNSPGFTGLTLSGDLAVDGGDITSNAGTFNFLTDNASVEVLNIGDPAGNLATTFPGTVDIDAGLNVGSSNQFMVSSTGVITGKGTNLTLIPAGELTGDINTARLPVATSTAKGAIELFSNTAQSEAANSVTTTASRTYGIQLNSAGQAVVNVPWANDQTPVRPVKVGSNNLTSSETLEIVGGTNVTVTETDGVVTFNSTATATRASLDLDTDDDVTFRNITIAGASNEGYLRGPTTLTIDPAAHGNDTGKVVIAGDLQVDGTTTTINSTIVEIDDLAIELAHDATSLSAINNAGIKIGTGPSAGLVEFIYSNANGRMELSSAMRIIGGLEATVIDGGTF